MSKTFTMSGLTSLDIDTKTFLDKFNYPILELLTTRKTVKNKVSIRKKYTHENLEKLMEKNHNKELFLDFYFTPNGNLGKQTSDKLERKKDLCESYEWLVFDTDSSDSEYDSETLINYIKDIGSNFSIDDILPNFIVKTNRGYHIYYKLKNPLLFNNDNNIYKKVYDYILDNFKNREEDLFDKSTHEPNRLFRVPGSLYRKIETNEDVFTELIYINQTSSLDIEELYQELYLKHDIDKKIETAHKKLSCGIGSINDNEINKTRNFSMREIIDEKVNQIDIKTVVEALGYKTKGNSMCDPNTGMETDGWRIFEKENIVNDFSNKKRRPGGTCIQFITMHFKGNLKNVYQFVNDKLYIDCKEVLNYQTQEVDISFDENANIETIFEENLGTINFLYDTYTMTYTAPKGLEQIATNFIIEIIGKIIISGQTKIIIQLVNEQMSSRGIFLPVDSKIGAVNKSLRQEGVFDIRINSDKFLNLIQLWLYKKINDIQEIKIVKNIGYSECMDYVAGDSVLKDNGELVKIDKLTGLVDNYIVNMDNTSEDANIKDISSSIKNIGINLYEGKNNYNKKDFTNLIKELSEIYESNIIIPLFLAIINSLFSGFYYNNNIKFPHIIVWGETRAGKTEIITFIKKILSFKDTGGIGTSSITPFPFLVSSSSGVMVHLTEWTNSAKYSEFIQLQAKDSFDFRDLVRGTADQKINVYKSRSNILFDGEEVPNQDALQTRSIICFFKKMYKKNIPEGFINRVERICSENEQLINYIIQSMKEVFKDRKNFIKLLTESQSVLYEHALKKGYIKEDDDTDRVLQNYAELLVILKQLTGKVFNSLEKEIDYISYNMGETIKNNKQFDSKIEHIKNFFTPIMSLFGKNSSISKGIISIDIQDKTIYVNKIILSSTINHEKTRASFENSISFLVRNDFMQEEFGMIRIDLNKPIHKTLYNQWKGFLISGYSTNNISYPDLDYNGYHTIIKILLEKIKPEQNEKKQD